MKKNERPTKYTDDGRRLKTSFVDAIYREWKTFYIDTATSTYEVIPIRS